tara:strand:+ start:6847 stop:7728 length:882 start_codon:yes stop_codon:yes gene_type:complete
MNVDINPMTGVPHSKTYMSGLSTNPVVLTVIIVIILAYYVFFSSLGGKSNSSGQGSEMSGKKETNIFEALLWSIFIVLILLNGVSYMFNVDIKASMKNLFSHEPEIDIIVDSENQFGDGNGDGNGDGDGVIPVPEIKIDKQVFHIPGNTFKYSDSKAICKAYGGRLATYKEIEDAYKKGADWCSYGWSDGQMALYPTQYEKWAHLQKIEDHEHDCGRPGINGGYIDNPDIKFGINCYGYKPEITNEESQIMQQSSIYPITEKEAKFNEQVKYWRKNLKELLVAPFNHNNWSII